MQNPYNSIAVLSINHKLILGFEVKIASTKSILNASKSSIVVTYEHGINYFNKFVLPENEPRLERHPNDHMVTLVKKIKDSQLFFIVGRTKNQSLELAAIELKPEVTILVKGNTAHTNDYVTEVVQGMYPQAWEIDEVHLVNLSGNKATLRLTKQANSSTEYNKPF